MVRHKFQRPIVVHLFIVKSQSRMNTSLPEGSYEMEQKSTFDDLAKKITSLLPGNVVQLQQDLESNIKALLQSTLSKMNLVTREEFDVQEALLQRTREKLDKLEKLLQELEAKN